VCANCCQMGFLAPLAFETEIKANFVPRVYFSKRTIFLFPGQKSGEKSCVADTFAN
jgi:hypothetical protein